jgi:hypothetical protein
VVGPSPDKTIFLYIGASEGFHVAAQGARLPIRR